MAAPYNKFNSFVEALAKKVHNLGADQLMVALTPNATPPVAGNTQLSNLAEIPYTNLSSRVLNIVSALQTAGILKVIVNDLVLTASGGPVATFRWVAIYNNSAPNKELICYFDYGQDVTLNAGETFTLDFDNINGLLQLA
jgi:hypothetical protein